MNRKDLRALTLVGPTRNNPVLDPLAELHLDNQQSIYAYVYVGNKILKISKKSKSRIFTEYNSLLAIMTAYFAHIYFSLLYVHLNVRLASPDLNGALKPSKMFGTNDVEN